MLGDVDAQGKGREMSNEMGRADYCRKHGCPLAKECGKVCDLLAEDEREEYSADSRPTEDERLDDPRHGQARSLNSWKRPL